ncbi:hypothetical protein Tco_0237506 [Tanacetum coccineum]
MKATMAWRCRACDGFGERLLLYPRIHQKHWTDPGDGRSDDGGGCEVVMARLLVVLGGDGSKEMAAMVRSCDGGEVAGEEVMVWRF